MYCVEQVMASKFLKCVHIREPLNKLISKIPRGVYYLS